MVVTLDATPLLGRRTGVGRYVAELLGELPAALRRAGEGPLVRVATFSARRHQVVDLPPDIVQVGRRAPARLLRALWSRSDYPSVEILTGATDLFHGTNFVSPPTRHAAEVVTVHDLVHVRDPTSVTPDVLAYDRLLRRAFGRGAVALVPSRATGAAMREHYGIPDERVVVTHLGVSAEWFAASEGGGVPSLPGVPERYLLFVGDGGPRKNLARLLEAHRRARVQDADTPSLVLAGPAGSLAAGHGPEVIGTGWLADHELRALVAGAAAILLPSLDEGFGLPVLEALAAGRPVLCADLPALREVGGGVARYIDPLDLDGWSGALASVGALPDDAETREARRRWAGRFTWSATADATVAAYRRALS